MRPFSNWGASYPNDEMQRLRKKLKLLRTKLNILMQINTLTGIWDETQVTENTFFISLRKKTLRLKQEITDQPFPRTSQFEFGRSL